MLKKFIEQNKLAIKKGLLWMPIIFTSIVLVIFSYAFYKHQLPNLWLISIILFNTIIGFPLLIMLTWFLKWLLYDNPTVKRNFNSFPFNQIEKLGFTKFLKNESSTEYTFEFYKGIINGFVVTCEVDTQNDPNNLKYKFYCKRHSTSKDEFNQIMKKIEQYNGNYNFDTITKAYHFKKHRLKSLKDLEYDLVEFSNLLLTEKFKP